MNNEEEINDLVIRIRRLRNGCTGVDCKNCLILISKSNVEKTLCSHLIKEEIIEEE